MKPTRKRHGRRLANRRGAVEVSMPKPASALSDAYEYGHAAGKAEGYRAGLLDAIKEAQTELGFWKRAEAAAPNQGSLEACQHAWTAMFKLKEALSAMEAERAK